MSKIKTLRNRNLITTLFSFPLLNLTLTLTSTLILTQIITTTISSATDVSVTDNEKIKMKRMNVDGHVVYQQHKQDENNSSSEETDPADQELIGLDKELKKNNQMLKGFTQKSIKYNKLKNVVEKMSEKHQEFVEQKDEYSKVVEQFNKQMECNSNPKSEGCQNSLKSSLSASDKRNITNLKDRNNPKLEESINLTIRKNLGLFQRCYQHELNVGTPFSGRVEFKFLIDEYGRILTSTIVNKNESVNESSRKTKMNYKFKDCLLTTLNSITFPNAYFQKGEKIQVFQPINFYNKKI
ncbi:MAG: hypothetical protein HQK51_04085 [Oligoflexia bacterium]|nr:hypothetical protein [Oligoflexia bacterium]